MMSLCFNSGFQVWRNWTTSSLKPSCRSSSKPLAISPDTWWGTGRTQRRTSRRRTSVKPSSPKVSDISSRSSSRRRCLTCLSRRWSRDPPLRQVRHAHYVIRHAHCVIRLCHFKIRFIYLSFFCPAGFFEQKISEYHRKMREKVKKH